MNEGRRNDVNNNDDNNDDDNDDGDDEDGDDDDNSDDEGEEVMSTRRRRRLGRRRDDELSTLKMTTTSIEGRTRAESCPENQTKNKSTWKKSVNNENNVGERTRMICESYCGPRGRLIEREEKYDVNAETEDGPRLM